MNDWTRKILPLVQPGASIIWAVFLTFAIVAALNAWGDAILPPDVRNWFEQQHWLSRFAIFCALGMAIWMVAYAIVVQIVAPLHFALDPAHETERSQRRWVRQLRIGTRLRVADNQAPLYCTVSRVDYTNSECFDVTWDDGQKSTVWYLDKDLFDFVPPAPPINS